MTLKSEVNKLEYFCLSTSHPTMEEVEKIKNNIEMLLKETEPSKAKDTWKRRYDFAYKFCLEKLELMAS